MNANKIAEELENISWIQGDGTAKPFQHYANFVRQQQAKLEKSQELLREYTALNMRQHAEIELLRNELDRAVELYTDKAIENEALHRFIDERGETGQLIIWKAQEK